jgi:gliding motility-associated-like protein
MKARFEVFSPKRFILLFLLSFTFSNSFATHIVGGEFTYQHVRDTLIASVLYHKYQITLNIYEDCITGDPSAIAQDNPAYFAVYNGTNFQHLTDADSANFSYFITVPTGFSNACVQNIQPTCLIKKTFIKNYYLQSSTWGYLISYQRCCRNTSIVNIVDPGSTGSTFFCIIPPTPYLNNSAVFKNYPPQIICLNNPLFYDHSATDADGDSLSYEFCTSVTCCLGGGPNNIKPFPPTAPNVSAPTYYDSVNYVPGFSSQQPITGFPRLQIDPVTGIISGTPNRTGRYLVTVCCHEWRNGVLINTTKREFQFVVTSCSKVVVADIPQYSTDPNTYIVNCKDYNIHFVNTSSGGFAYHWDFGVAGISYDTSNEFEPTFVYPDTGTFEVKLIVNPSSTCPDSITRLVKVYPKFRANFSDSGRQCPGATLFFKDLSSATIQPITNWKWNFGDGDSSFVQNPSHNYLFGGIYNVILISSNIKNCTDTTVKQVVIDNFFPYAGRDTTIVKGEKIIFNATGGTQYLWSPPTNLNDTTIYNPTGIYPDTGLFSYIVYVQSIYGCSGYDTINVSVVNEAAFFVPTAFSPNGDGKNDIFRPISIGYRKLNYLRVYNRWGEKVYFGQSLDAGWDGTYKNKQADMGTYYWELSYTDRFGNEGFLKGDVTLIR